MEAGARGGARRLRRRRRQGRGRLRHRGEEPKEMGGRNLCGAHGWPMISG
jgi:hypothetical protein